MTIEEQKRIANIVSDILAADKGKRFDAFCNIEDRMSMYEGYIIMQLTLLYYKVKRGIVTKEDADIYHREILGHLLDDGMFLGHLNKKAITSDVAQEFKHLPHKDEIVDVIGLMVDMANVAFERGYKAGKKELFFD